MTHTLLDNLKNSFEDLHQADWSRLDEFYADDILFRDPVHELRGLVALQDYLTELCADLVDCRFEYLDELRSDKAAYLKWIMHFRHPRLGNEPIHVRGVSHISWNEKIDFHEDFYDMGALLYERLPILGNVTRWLRLRLAG